MSSSWHRVSPGIAKPAKPDRPYTIVTCYTSCRQVLPSAEGHVKLSVDQNGLTFNTSCISYGATATAVSSALNALGLIEDLGGASVTREGDGSSEYSYGFVYYLSASNTSISLTESVKTQFLGSGEDFDCAKLWTSGRWDEAANWDAGVLPASDDEASPT